MLGSSAGTNVDSDIGSSTASALKALLSLVWEGGNNC